MKSEKNIVIYLLVLFASSATSCNKSISEKKQRFYYSTTCKNVDSIWQFFTVENDPIEIVQLLCNAQSNLSRLGLTDSSAKLIKKMDNLAGKLNNPRFYAYVYLNSAFESLVKGDMANALANFNRRNKYLNGADDINVLMSHQFKGNYYYMDGQIDSARGAFVNGYNLARDKGDTTMMYSFALNSGTTYFDLQLTSMAAYYFSEAYLIGVQRGDVSMMLINNLVATLISEGNYEEAIKKCEENQAKWMADPLNSGSILLKLNYSFLLNRQGEYKRSEHILREVSVKSIPKIHLSYYYANYLESLFSQNRKIDFKNMLDTLVPFVYSNQPRSTTEMKSILLKAVDSELFNPDLNRFIGFYKSSLIKDSDHYTSSEYCDFLSHVYKKKSQFNQANLWENRGIRHKLDLSITRDSLRLQDVVNQIAQVDLNHKLASKQKALDLSLIHI
jgi:tetratricopeptide (TPR) repeat protein